MAKRGKSKILASMLAVSTMAVFYTAPVMAADLTVDVGNGGNLSTSIEFPWGGGFDVLPVTGTFTVAGSDIANALSGQDVTLGAVSANSVTTTGDIVSHNGTQEYSLNQIGRNTQAIYGVTVNGQNVTSINGRVVAGNVTMENGNITTNGTVVAREVANSSGVTLSNLNNAVNTLNNKTQNIDAEKTTAGTTTFNGDVNVDGTISAAGGKFNVDSRGVLTTDTVIATTGQFGDVIVTGDSLNNVGFIDGAAVSGNNGALTVSGVELNNGLVDGVDVSTLSTAATDISELQNKTQNMSAGKNYTTFKGSLSTEGSISSGNDAVKLRGNWGQEAAIDLRDANNNYSTLTATKLATINNVIDDEGNVVGNTVKTTSGADLDEVNGRTQNITATEGNTTFTGSVNVGDTRITSGGITTDVVSANEVQVGNTLIQNETISTGNVFSTNYNLEQVGANLGNLQDDFNTTNANVGGIIRDAAEGAAYGEGVTSIEGIVSVDGNTGFVNIGTGNGNGILINSSNGQIIANQVVANSIGANQVATENLTAGNGALRVTEDGTIRVQSNDLLMQNGSGESVVMTDGGLNLMTVGDNGTGMVTLDNGVVSLMGGGTSTVTINGNGTTFGTVLGNETTNINGGTVTASEDVVADGVSLKNLAGEFGETNANVAGIKRTGSEEEGWTTTIEDTLSVSDDQVLAQTGSSQLVLTGDVAGLSSGNASFALTNNELQLSVAGNGMTVNQFGTTLNGAVNFTGHDGNSYTLSDLEGRVYDLEQKTQNITSSEPGQGGEGSTVPPTTDGHTGVEGDVTVGGDLNVNGSVNVGDTIIKDDGINIGEGTHIGDGVVSSTNGNFDNIDANKATIGETNISKDGTVTTNKVVTGNTTLDNEGLNVGGKTSVTADGVNVGGAEGTSIKHDEISVGDGGYIGGGDVVSGEGVSLNQTAERVGSLENRVGELEDRIDKVGAMAAAIANLRSMGYDPAAPTEVAVGIGQYRDETGAALGLFHYPNRDFMLSLSVSTSGDEVMGGIGATWKFGRKSPEKVAEIKKAQAEADVRRAEAQKLEKAEAMKQAAKEAKIKAQQERHAKLAAERAAQAEAAK